MNPFQSDNIWKKKARQGKAQQHPLTPQQEWQKQVNSSSLWLGGGVVLLALYLAAVRAGTVALDASAVVLIVVVGCFCVYTAASLGRLMKNKPEEKAAKKKKKAKKIDNAYRKPENLRIFRLLFFGFPRRAQSCRAGFMAFIKFFSAGYVLFCVPKENQKSTRYFRGAGGTN